MFETRYYTRFDKEYPDKLRFIRDPPAGIYVRGDLPDPDKKTVAIIGARACSQYGRNMAEYFARQLAMNGVQIVSGMARGIDGVAQKAALCEGGRSFGVLGAGADVVYPKENRDIYEMIQGHGGLITEFPDGTAPLPQHFASRNRIISALCDALLVIEARVRSGTGITVSYALDQGRDVFAVPARLTDPLSAGCIKMISEGAGIAASPNDILKSLGLMQEEKVKGKDGSKVVLKNLTRDERAVFACLDLYPVSIDEIVRMSRLSIDDAMASVMSLCIKGIAKECSACNYIRSR